MTTLPTIVGGGNLGTSNNAYETFSVNTTETLSFALGDTPANFANMNSASWTVEYSLTGARDNDTFAFGLRIVSGATILAAADAGGTFVTVSSSVTNTTDTTSGPTSFGYVNTGASKTLWDAATVELQQTHTQVKGGDNVAIRVDYFALTGDYTIGVINTPVSADAGSFTLSGYAADVGVAVPVALLTSGISVTNATSYNTASVTVTAGRPVMVVVFAAGLNTSDNNTPPTVSGAGQTWTQLDSFVTGWGHSTYDDYCRVSTFVTTAASGGSGALTINFGSQTQDGLSWSVVEIADGLDFGSLNTPQYTGTNTTSISHTLPTVGASDRQLAIGLYINFGATAPGTWTGDAQLTDLSTTSQLDGSWAHGMRVEYSDAGGDTTFSHSTANAGGLAAMAYSIQVATTSVALNAGAFTLTGYDVAETTLIAVPVDAGSFTLTGLNAATGLSQSVPLDAGSFTVTGQDATATFATSLPLAAGTFGLTGQDAAISANRALPLDAGSFALTGHDATASRTKSITADAGSFALSGHDAAIAYATTAALDAGSLSITGYSISFAATIVADLNAGSFALTGLGADASLSAGVNLTAGTFAVTGHSTAETFARQSALDPGAFSLSGHDLDVTAGTVVGLGVGSFALSGYQPSLAFNFGAVLDAGAFTLTGLSTNVAVGGAIALDTGGFALSGYSVDQSLRRGVSLDAGAFLLTWNDLDISVGESVVCEAGTFTLTGNDASVEVAGAVALDPGTFTLTGYASVQSLSRSTSLDAGSFTLTGHDATAIATEVVALASGAFTIAGYDIATVTPKLISGTLVTRQGATQANLTMISWAWFDATDPVSFGAPTDQGEVETTTSSGAFVIKLPNTALGSGQYGTLVLRSDDGSLFGAYNMAVQ